MTRLVLTSAFERALAYAAQLHRHQWRKVNEVPYVSHLLAVAALVLEDGGSEAEAIAALLHDAVEDQGGLAVLTDIQARFGAGVAALVQGCTVPPRPLGQSWEGHQQQYLRQVRGASPSVQRIVLADKLHNGRCLVVNLAQAGEVTWQAFAGSRSQVEWFYQQVLLCFAVIKPGWMAAELAQVVRRLEDGPSDRSAMSQGLERPWALGGNDWAVSEQSNNSVP